MGPETWIDPRADCALCPRLQQFRNLHQTRNPDWHNRPVDTWAARDGVENIRLLIVGLAPGLKGANRTGRPFTGDFAGDLLYETLIEFGLASGSYGADPEDGLQLVGSAITNAVRCVPPENKPVAAEINQCRQFLRATLEHFSSLEIVVTLGKISHDSTCRALGIPPSKAPFAHNRKHPAGNLTIVSSYHCSRYNTNTGRLTPQMFKAVFENVREMLEAG